MDGFSFVERVVWLLPVPVPGSARGFKYRLAQAEDGVCVVRYDNETGKGDYRHIGSEERPCGFSTPEQLLVDFWRDVEDWRMQR